VLKPRARGTNDGTLVGSVHVESPRNKVSYDTNRLARVTVLWRSQGLKTAGIRGDGHDR
jgi:hypothetical protein